MHASILLTSLVAAGSVHASTAAGSWKVRTDFTGCPEKPPLEASITDTENNGIEGISPSFGITDYTLPTPFDGSIFVRAGGTEAGLGGTYPPQHILLNVYNETKSIQPGQPGIWAKAVIIPGSGVNPKRPGDPERGGELATVAKMSWNAGIEAVNSVSRGQIDLGVSPVVSTTVNGGTLEVKYCVDPEASGFPKPAN
ncbi:hypothetical protein CTA2_12581 [Colletotrichum tanaceti]|uniref:Uncharacterized protein n=1 Tax=Colletotrichum tanaceti TaxID=1306861 RepID=A0A4U6X3B5_9PEZI|nr:hypothetical protein CTA2_12581 [Colletotrichum tanaceti]TKW49850.1 hypothetical protein CTA1_11182 [Colletotrichum tanaceti]